MFIYVIITILVTGWNGYVVKGLGFWSIVGEKVKVQISL
jgi:hypothetical protein